MPIMFSLVPCICSTVPSSSTDFGGIKIVVKMVKVVDQSDESSVSGTETPTEVTVTDMVSLRVRQTCTAHDVCIYTHTHAHTHTLGVS